VISGFIMVHVTREAETPLGFMLNRVSRIVPLYWLGTFAVVLAVYIVPWSFPHALTDLPHVLLSLGFIPAADARGVFEPVLFVGWTLNFEMAFYAIFALSLFAARRYRMAVLVAGLAALFAIGRLAGETSPAGFYGNPILFEFAAGCFIGVAVRNPALRSLLDRLPARLIIAVGAAGLLATAFLPPFVMPRAIQWGIPAALIVFGVVVLDTCKPASARSIAMHLGDASYSAYLLHPFVVLSVGMLTLRLLGPGWIAAAVMMPATLIGTAIVSGLSFRIIEKPFASVLRRLFGLQQSRRAAAAVTS
jgi:exopolysaccharide production protein ExoZ